MGVVRITRYHRVAICLADKSVSMAGMDSIEYRYYSAVCTALADLGLTCGGDDQLFTIVHGASGGPGHQLYHTGPTVWR